MVATGSWTCGECGRVCKSCGGLTKHSSTHKKHSRVGEVCGNLHRIYHPTLDGFFLSFSSVVLLTQPLSGKPCSQTGAFLPPGTPPTPPPPKSDDDWSPFASRAGFELAEVLYTTASLSNPIIDKLLDLWNATLVPHNDAAPFSDRKDVHSAIDAIKLGGVPWKSYTARYNGLYPEDGPTPEWMTNNYQLWYRDPRRVIHNLLANPDLTDSMDYVPYREFGEDGK